MPLRFLGPRYWGTWIALALLRLLGGLSQPAMIRAGRVLGRIARALPLNYVKVARCNIKLCLPELSERERQRVLKEHFAALGASLCETAMSWWGSDERLKAVGTIEGLEHLQAALGRGRGAILLTAHFTTLEIGGYILNTATRLGVVYRLPKNALLAHFIEAKRGRRTQHAIGRDDIRSMVRALRENACIWYATDQSFRKKGAVMVPFFGIPAATNVATSRLARLTGAAVLLFSHERLPDAKGYRLRISPALEDFPSDSAVADAERIHHWIESEVRRIPEQYWWIHRRFKGLSDDYPNYYGSAARHTERSRTRPTSGVGA
jgi:Kdo2-lipid IVA lauroyltransferase/acyltransferase